VLPEDIEVLRQGKDSTATLRYTQTVEFFPRMKYPLQLRMAVGALSLFAAPEIPEPTPEVARAELTPAEDVNARPVGHDALLALTAIHAPG
jgi:hypothetical protein